MTSSVELMNVLWLCITVLVSLQAELASIIMLMKVILYFSEYNVRGL